jgi:cytochrome c553
MKSIKVIATFTVLAFSSSLAAEPSLSMSKGETLFRTAGGYGCSTCHGMFATGGGNVGGDIRGKTLSDINTVLDTEPTMKLLSEALDASKRELLAFYLVELGKVPSIEWIIEDKPTRQSASLTQGLETELVIFNKRLESITIPLSTVSSDAIVIQPYETKAIRWTPKPGQIQLNYKQNYLDIEFK